MKKSLIAIAFTVASMPMFAAHQAAGQTPAPAPGSVATSPAKPAVKAKKHHTKVVKKSVKKDATTAPVAK
jgi:hypothetical protein